MTPIKCADFWKRINYLYNFKFKNVFSYFGNHHSADHYFDSIGDWHHVDHYYHRRRHLDYLGHQNVIAYSVCLKIQNPNREGKGLFLFVIDFVDSIIFLKYIFLYNMLQHYDDFLYIFLRWLLCIFQFSNIVNIQINMINLNFFFHGE